MKSLGLSLLLSVFSTLALAFGALAEAPARATDPASSPSGQEATKFLRTKQEAVSALLRKPAKDKAEEEKRHKQLDGLLEGFLDYDKLAEKSLEDHWKSRSEGQRKEFIRLLTELIQRNYQRNLTRTLEFSVKYKGEKTTSDGITVATLARSKTEKRAEPVAIDYLMQPAGTAFRVVDITTDGVSLVRNYRSQFNRIIRKDGWDALIKRMKSRVQEGSDEI